MRFEKPVREEQEVTINILYDEEVVIIYANRKETIDSLINELGRPTKKYKRGKTYWTGAEWRLSFKDSHIISKVLNKDIFIDRKFKLKKDKIVSKEKYQQIELII